MMPFPVRRLAAFCLVAVLIGLSGAKVQSSAAADPTVSLVAVSGYAGHAFVYAQVTESGNAYPAPTGTGYQSPYYSKWTRQPLGTASCPWMWTAYVFDRNTNRQVNAPPPTAVRPNFGTTTLFCASPSTTPVQEPAVAEASARLDLDLQVSLSPPNSVAGTPSLLAARLAASLTQDLDLYLNMAIQDWTVNPWSVDFGDGSLTRVSGPSASTLQLPHTYSTAGSYDAKVVATVTGHAQAARYDRYGNVNLLQRPFSVEIGNDTLATATPPTRSYLPPQAEVTVSPTLEMSPPAAPSFRHVDALRGALTSFGVHLLITREAQIRIGSRLVGTASSRLVRWRYDGPPSEGPALTVTAPGSVWDPGTPLRLQWNQPNRVSARQIQDYSVPLTLYLESRYQDGHVSLYVLRSSFLVTVDFAAQSG